MIKEYIIKKSLDLILSIGLKVIKNTKFGLKSARQDIEEALNTHLRTVKNWSSEISFADLKKSKSLDEIFIDLDLYVYPRRIRLNIDEKISKIPLEKIFKKDANHIALLGQPGSGKTTSMKHLCRSIIFDENFYPDIFDFPILIQLRDFNKIGKQSDYKKGLIYNYVFDILGLKMDNDSSNEEDQIQSVKEKIVTEILNNVKALIILDGYDEIQYYNRRELIIHELEKLVKTIESSKFIITSRTAEFSYRTEKLSTYELSPLDDSQIYKFAHRWLKNKEAAEILLKDIRNSPFYDTTIRPLTIAHLCAIFERAGKIPEKPKTVYKKIVNLLLEEWDEQKNVKRLSKYSDFEIDRKFEFLSNLAYVLTVSSSNVIFSKNDLEYAYLKIFQDFDLNRNDAESVVTELESQTGLFLQAGYHQYEFAHKSLQEYLTAEFIVKLPSIPNQRNILIRLPDELAIAVTISSSPSYYFMELVNHRILPHKFNSKFIKSFINRLMVEKPDFNLAEDVGISALLLYSIYLNSLSEDQAQLKLFYPDNLFMQFESLIHSIFKRNTQTLISSLYNQTGKLESDSGHSILLLQLKDKKYKRFPKVLYCRDSFLKEININ